MDISERTDLEGANLTEPNLKLTNLKWANLGETYGLSLDQLSEVKTLYGIKLDEELLIKLKENYPALFEVPD
jgi:Pentapeptide repeats (8 copies).